MLSGLRPFAGDGNVAHVLLDGCTKILGLVLARGRRLIVSAVRSVGLLLWRALARLVALLVHPGLREVIAECRAVTIRVVACGAVLTIVVTIVLDLYATFAATPASSSEQKSEWSTVVRPYPAFALPIPELIATAPAYAIRRHNFGGGRRHVMTFGVPGSGEPYALVEIYRPGAEFTRFGEPVAAMTALVAETGAARLTAAATLPDTKFGPVDIVEFSMKSPTGPRHCAGFVRGVAEPRFQIAGWYCNAGPELVDRSTLACMLDRLTLVSAASDPTLTEFFGRAELRRNFCSQKAAQVAAARKRTEWIEAESAPELRGRLAGR